MAWRVKDKPRTVKVTTELAKQFAEMETPHDRPLNERRLMVYERMLKQGGFRPVTWATCECLETGQTYRVNGQHTSTMLSKHADIQDFYAIIETYTADTLDDVAKLWGTFDSRISIRTNSDINDSFAATIPEMAQMSTRFVNLCVTALSYSKWQDSYSMIPAPERAELLLDNVEFCLWAEWLFNGGKDRSTTRHLHRGPVVAAMHASWSKSRKAAGEFWVAVRDETGLSPDVPDRRLAKWLASMHVDSGQGAVAAKSRRAKQREFYVKCLHAWNAWRRGQKTDLKYYPAAKIPAVS